MIAVRVFAVDLKVLLLSDTSSDGSSLRDTKRFQSSIKA